ncbi:MAG: 3-oxoacid CoA-transferase subunit A [Chloroflexi bacterium]|nr:3-oxoacid CoA-transferase subunit A [Chloroflexota bacterium]MCH7654848.1 3-oxoacid CoA-transferase subunit A [Chloroflexota bacterium]
MKSKVYESFDAAVADIADGSTIMFSGFAGPGTPRNLIAALLAQGASGLTVISNTPGSWGDGPIDLKALIDAGRVRRVVAAFTAATHPSMRRAFDELYEAGEIEAELVPQGTLAERIRAGGAGIGAFYTPTGVGTETAEGKEVRSFEGRDYVLELPLRADYAMLRAHRADEMGNLQYVHTQRNFGPIMARAARTTLAELDGPVAAAGEIDPNQVHTPGIFVDRMVVVPADGIQEGARGG